MFNPSKYILFLVLLVCASLKTHAALNLDSLLKVLDRTESDSINLNLYSKTFSRMDPFERDARTLIGNWLLLKSKQVNNYEVLSKTYHNFGVIYIEENNNIRASEFFKQALEISEEHQLYHVTARILNSMGAMHWGFGQYDEATKYFNQAIEAGLKSSKTTGLGIMYSNLAGVCFEMGYEVEDSNARGFFYSELGLQIAEKQKDTVALITIHNNLSYVYLEKGEYDSALYVLQKNENLIRLSKDDEKLVTHYLRVAQAYQVKKDYKQALEIYNLGLSYAKKYKSAKWEYNYYTAMAQTYEEMGDYKNANKYNILYSEVHDSIISIENYKAAAEINSKYESEKKEKKILKLSKEKQISDLEKAKNAEITDMLKIIIGAIALILLLLIFLTIFLIRTNSDRKKANQKLNEKNIEIQNQSDKLSEQARLISRYQSQMNPHFIFNALNSIQGFVVNDDKEKTINQLQYFSILMRETLNNSEQEHITLQKEIDYLKTYVAFEQVKFSNKIDFEINLPEDVDQILLPAMMIQPFIENSIKHAGFHTLTKPQVTLTISIVENLLRISISDNGKGINLKDDNVVKNSHALSIVQSRLNIIFKAANIEMRPEYFEIISDTSKKPGTEIIFYLPLLYNY